MTKQRWSPDQIGDLSGKTVVVTGANSGIGAATAAVLAGHGAHVILAVRNVSAGQQVAATITGSTDVRRLDLASLASVKAFAESMDSPLDLLVNNAGVMTPPRRRETADGFELQFGTNHLGHFALTARLLPHLLASSAPRVTTVSSIAHHRGTRALLDSSPAQAYSPQTTYGDSKLANLLFALELQRRASAAGSALVSTAAHPGVAATSLVTSKDGLGSLRPVRLLAPLAMKAVLASASAGAEAILYAATEASPGSYTGPQRFHESRGPIGPAKLSSLARDQDLAAALWERSLELTDVTFDFTETAGA